MPFITRNWRQILHIGTTLLSFIDGHAWTKARRPPLSRERRGRTAARDRRPAASDGCREIEEAAEILGIDLVLLERRVRARRLSCREIKGKITFSLAEVLSLKEDEDRRNALNADPETLRKLVDSCKDQLIDIRSERVHQPVSLLFANRTREVRMHGNRPQHAVGWLPERGSRQPRIRRNRVEPRTHQQLGISDHDDLLRCRRSGGWLLRSAVCSRRQLRAGRAQGRRAKVFYLD